MRKEIVYCDITGKEGAVVIRIFSEKEVDPSGNGYVEHYKELDIAPSVLQARVNEFLSTKGEGQTLLWTILNKGRKT